MCADCHTTVRSSLFVRDAGLKMFLVFTLRAHSIGLSLSTGQSVVHMQSMKITCGLHYYARLDCSCVGLSNLAVSQPSCFLRVPSQLGTERVLQLTDYCFCSTLEHRKRIATGFDESSTCRVVFVKDHLTSAHYQKPVTPQDIKKTTITLS
ncbi:hypothetical protein CSKR_103689 [Clonorchis sinensis]|uniref:Uncharacterized protein n=1 Tax=Clonorchis sinensis TaxID=79923 RepID=A0A419PKG3_CLOSI|nr:hypothetical protein CSKR_103689 [Clonorchis sinensis]